MRTPTHALQGCPEFKNLQPWSLRDNATVQAMALALVSARTELDRYKAEKEGWDTKDVHFRATLSDA